MSLLESDVTNLIFDDISVYNLTCLNDGCFSNIHSSDSFLLRNSNFDQIKSSLDGGCLNLQNIVNLIID
jgi:hypothetical protein